MASNVDHWPGIRAVTRRLFVLLAATLTWCACAQRQSMTDEEKRSAIAGMYRGYHKDFPDIVDISVDDLAKLRENEDVVIVDVREPNEQAVSMIPGAITKEEFERRKVELRDKPIVVHCTIGYRSGVYAEGLAKDGIAAQNLEGSILSWAHAGQPLIDPKTGGPTKRVHVYGREWDLLPEGYEAVY